MNTITRRFIKPARRAVARTLRGPAPLPEVQSERAEAESWFDGWWHGIAVGSVIGAGVIVLLLGTLGRLG